MRVSFWAHRVSGTQKIICTPRVRSGWWDVEDPTVLDFSEIGTTPCVSEYGGTWSDMASMYRSKH